MFVEEDFVWFSFVFELMIFDFEYFGFIFIEVMEIMGLDFVYEVGVLGSYFFFEIMCGGVVLLDFDNDGDLDIYFINGNWLYDEFDEMIEIVGNCFFE